MLQWGQSRQPVHPVAALSAGISSAWAPPREQKSVICPENIPPSPQSSQMSSANLHLQWLRKKDEHSGQKHSLWQTFMTLKSRSFRSPHFASTIDLSLKLTGSTTRIAFGVNPIWITMSYSWIGTGEKWSDLCGARRWVTRNIKAKDWL